MGGSKKPKEAKEPGEQPAKRKRKSVAPPDGYDAAQDAMFDEIVVEQTEDTQQKNVKEDPSVGADVVVIHAGSSLLRVGLSTHHAHALPD